MKNNKFAKISLLILSLALVIAAAFTMTATAEETPAKPEIISQNVAYEGDFALVYAVDAEGITGPVTLNVYDVYPAAGASIAPVWTGSDAEPEYVEGNLNKNVYKFTTNGIAAADMCKQFYIQAEANGEKSDVLRYSVAEYLYERLATPTTEANPTADQRELYNLVIAYGDQAQKVIGGIADSTDRIKNYQFVTVGEGGKLDTYFTQGVYKIGSKLPVATDDVTATTTWTVTAYNADGSYAAPATVETVTVEKAARLHVSLDSSVAFSYTPGYNNFDNLDEGAALNKNYTQSYGTKVQGSNIDTTTFFSKYDGRGAVIYTDKLTTGDYIQMNYDVTGKSASAVGSDDANLAFEFSCDLKMETSGNDTDGIVIQLSGNTSTIPQFEFRIAQRWSDKTLRENPYVYNANKSSEAKGFAGVDPTDWMHVRVIIYKNEPNYAYIYFNGDTTNYLRLETSYNNTIASSFSTSRLTVNIKGVNSNSNMDNADTIWMDNVYLGYRIVENPHTAQ